MAHAPPPSGHLRLILREQKIFPTTKESYRVYIGTSSLKPAFMPIHSLRVGWRNLERVSLIFAIIISFVIFTVFPLVYVLYFEEFLIDDSLGFMILKNN